MQQSFAGACQVADATVSQIAGAGFGVAGYPARQTLIEIAKELVYE